MKRLLLLLTLLLPLHAQTATNASAAAGTVYTELSPFGAGNYLGGLGASLNVTVNQAIFAEMSLTSNPMVPNVLLGARTNINSFHVKRQVVTPFIFISFGVSIHDIPEIKSTVLAQTSVPSIVTAIGTTPGFTERYGGGFDFPLQRSKHGLHVGIGALIQSGNGWESAPFIYLSKTF
jgi:hypothetical protein